MSSWFLIAFLLMSSASAFEFKKSDGRLRLQQIACTEGEQMVNALSIWSQRAGDMRGKSCQKSPASSSGSICTYDVTDCVPDHVLKYQGAKAEVDGPNCWNLALVLGNILPALRKSPPEEMSFFMSSPLCRALKDGETREPGDVGAIRKNERPSRGQESHTFIYVSENLVYSKNGYEKEHPFSLQSMENVYDTYGVAKNPECRKNQITTASKKCSNAVDFFRCDSMQDYLKKNSQVPKEIAESFKKLDEIEICAEDRWIHGTTLSSEARKNIVETSQALTEVLKNATQTADFQKLKSEDQAFLLGALQIRLQALSEQFADMGTSFGFYKKYEDSEALSELAESVKKASKEVKSIR